MGEIWKVTLQYFLIFAAIASSTPVDFEYKVPSTSRRRTEGGDSGDGFARNDGAWDTFDDTEDAKGC